LKQRSNDTWWLLLSLVFVALIITGICVSGTAESLPFKISNEGKYAFTICTGLALWITGVSIGLFIKQRRARRAKSAPIRMREQAGEQEPAPDNSFDNEYSDELDDRDEFETQFGGNESSQDLTSDDEEDDEETEVTPEPSESEHAQVIPPENSPHRSARTNTSGFTIEEIKLIQNLAPLADKELTEELNRVESTVLPEAEATLRILEAYHQEVVTTALKINEKVNAFLSGWLVEKKGKQAQGEGNTQKRNTKKIEPVERDVAFLKTKKGILEGKYFKDQPQSIDDAQDDRIKKEIKEREKIEKQKVKKAGKSKRKVKTKKNAPQTWEYKVAEKKWYDYIATYKQKITDAETKIQTQHDNIKAIHRNAESIRVQIASSASIEEKAKLILSSPHSPLARTTSSYALPPRSATWGNDTENVDPRTGRTATRRVKRHQSTHQLAPAVIEELNTRNDGPKRHRHRRRHHRNSNADAGT